MLDWILRILCWKTVTVATLLLEYLLLTSLVWAIYSISFCRKSLVSVYLIYTLECIGKLNLLKAQLCAFNTSDSTTIPLTVQNWQITSFVPDSTDLVVDSSNKCLAVRTVGMQRCPGFHKNVNFAK